MTSSIYQIKNLRAHKYANASIITINDKIMLKSYNTIVLEYNKTTKQLKVNGLYSMTTRKHIGYFLKEILPSVSYQDVKDAYNKNGILQLA